ncbi:glycan metabolism protein RagB [Parapedobacter defluvii]|uniref:Glycan metabolism protein RagB n=2 Tax=Parapedobacter defluvii TaxID=2045106 RepID=A0ABQ1L1H4_9SPHI|nr:glycan metabolism protein RagB [Parapedobacter defluvii]
MGMLALLSQSCGHEFLEVKSDISIGSPSTIADYQALLDNGNSVMNNNASFVLGMIGGEEFYIDDSRWLNYPSISQKNAYVWAENVYERESVGDWNSGYQRILYANMALEGLKNIEPSAVERDAWNMAQGSALFFRAWNYFQLAQLFCKPYEAVTAANELGLPLRLEPDVTIKSRRASLSETYGRMLADLEEAQLLLPDKPSVKMRPSKVACYALLARIYLQMENYELAEQYAEKTLRIQDDLIDYNALPIEASYPFPTGYGAENEEVIFFCYIPSYPMFSTAQMHVEEGLLNLYHDNDLRLSVFYATGSGGNVFFRGSYYGSIAPFVGLSTSEVLLIRAECYARRGALELALADMNRLGIHRFEHGYFGSFEGLNSEQVLQLVLEERRRELAFRGIRWEDRRRLNKDSRFATTISRTIGGRLYELTPGSNRYVWPLPDEVIELTGMQQNPR